MKVATSTDSNIRLAYMAMNDFEIFQTEGFAGKTAEETIWNWARLVNRG